MALLLHNIEKHSDYTSQPILPETRAFFPAHSADVATGVSFYPVSCSLVLPSPLMAPGCASHLGGHGEALGSWRGRRKVPWVGRTTTHAGDRRRQPPPCQQRETDAAFLNRSKCCGRERHCTSCCASISKYPETKRHGWRHHLVC